MCSAYKLNKQGDNIQPWHTPFPIWNQSFVPCPVLLFFLFLLRFIYCYIFSSVAQSCPTLCNPMNHSMPRLPVHHQLPESTQTHVHRVCDAFQPSHPLSSPSPPALNLSQHQGLFQWVSSWHQVAKVLEFQLQHQSLQWTPRTNLLLCSKFSKPGFSNMWTMNFQIFKLVLEKNQKSNCQHSLGHR